MFADKSGVMFAVKDRAGWTKAEDVQGEIKDEQTLKLQKQTIFSGLTELIRLQERIIYPQKLQNPFTQGELCQEETKRKVLMTPQNKMHNNMTMSQTIILIIFEYDQCSLYFVIHMQAWVDHWGGAQVKQLSHWCKKQGGWGGGG